MSKSKVSAKRRAKRDKRATRYNKRAGRHEEKSVENIVDELFKTKGEG